jgi:hypothetical protein
MAVTDPDAGTLCEHIVRNIVDKWLMKPRLASWAHPGFAITRKPVETLAFKVSCDVGVGGVVCEEVLDWGVRDGTRG